MFCFALVCIGALSPVNAWAQTTVTRAADAVTVTTKAADWPLKVDSVFARLQAAMASFHEVESVTEYTRSSERLDATQPGVSLMQRDRFVKVAFRRDTRLPALMFKLEESETTCVGTEPCIASAKTRIVGPIKSFDRVAQLRDPILDLDDTQALVIEVTDAQDGTAVATSKFEISSATFEKGLTNFLSTYSHRSSLPTQQQALGVIAGVLQHLHKKVIQ